MRVSVIGMGKLGFPVALAWGTVHDVVGYDVSPHAKQILNSRKYPHKEEGAQNLIEKTTLKIVDDIDEAVRHGDVVFIAVQTPHQPEFEGITRMPEHRSDFDYTALKQAVRWTAESAELLKKPIVMVVISTVLPGTSEKELRPILIGNPYVQFCYSPMFIAMGTTIADTLDPEMVLLGLGLDETKSSSSAFEAMQTFYRPLHKAALMPMAVSSAELAKVAYNCFLSLKISAANTIMEIAHKTGADCDEVSNALAKATDRVASAKYMKGGMGDGGGCFVEGELIHTENGVRAIDDIEKGDRVLGGDGQFHEVLETYRRPFRGPVYTVKGRGLTRFTVTGDHPVYVAKDLRAINANGRRDQNHGPQFGQLTQIRACALTDDHYLVFPSPRHQTPVREHWEPPRGRSGPAPRSVNIHNEEEYALLAGYYMAEGNIWFDRNKNFAPMRVSFSFNTATDGDYIAELVEILKRMVCGAPISVKSVNDRESCTEVRIGSTQLAKLLDHDFGHGFENKFVPAWILNSDKNSAACLRSLFRGDGSSHKDGISFSTVSPYLAYGVSFMLRRHGIPSTLQFHPKRVGTDGVVHRSAYDLGVNNAAYIEKLAQIVGMPIRHQMQDKQYPNTIFERDGYWYHYIYSIEKSEYEGTVYNINVADVHNYVSVGGLVANCHPRDIIALSWLAQEHALSYDLFGAMIAARENQTEWLAELCCDAALIPFEEQERMQALKLPIRSKLPIVILGKAYKKGTNLTVGSPAILLKNILDEYRGFHVEQWDPHVDPERAFTEPAVFLIGTDHEEFFSMTFPPGSKIIDPWGKMQDQPGSTVMRVGRR